MHSRLCKKLGAINSDTNGISKNWIGDDECIWTAIKYGEYHLKYTYDRIRMKKELVKWHKMYGIYIEYRNTHSLCGGDHWRSKNARQAL